MANFLRLIAALVIALVSGAASASFPPPQTWHGEIGSLATPSVSSAAGVCGVLGPILNQFYGATGYYAQWSAEYGACVDYREDGSSFGLTGAKKDPLVCPDHSTLGSDGLCTCTSGFVENGAACVPAPPASCPAGQVHTVDGTCGSCELGSHQVGDTCVKDPASPEYCQQNAGSKDVSQVIASVTNVAPAKGCVPTIYSDGLGCVATFEREFASKDADTAKWLNRGTFTLTAATCDLDPAATGQDPAKPAETTKTTCAGYEGSVNGVKTCVPYSGSNGVVSDSGKTSTDTGADGSTVKTDTKQTTNCDAQGACTITTTTTKTTTAADGTVSVSVTGNTTGTTKAAYCATAAGKTDSACTGLAATPPSTGSGSGTGSGNGSGDSSFGGSCASDFQCSGDAVQCATARATWKTFCEASTLNDAAKNGIAAAMAKAGTDQSAALDAGTTNVGPTGFDTTDALGGGSCAIDKTVTVMGVSVVMPLASVCPYLQYAGLAFVAVALLAGALIVFKT